MTERYTIGIDLGGGGCRALLVHAGSGATTRASRPLAVSTSPASPLGADLDPAAAVAAFREMIEQVLATRGVSPDQVAGIAATSMRHGSVLLDDRGRELLAAPNRDARGAGQAGALAAEHGREIHRRTGHWPNPVQPAARLLWLAESQPEVLARAVCHLSLSDWLAFRLCGEVASEVSQAGESGLLDLVTGEWAWDWIERLGLPRAIFPPLLRPGARLGRVSPEGAAAFGLLAGTPVAVGGADSQCALLGAGCVAPGDVGIVAGTSAPVMRVAERPPRESAGRLWAGHHVVADRWVLESNAGGIGDALSWIAGAFYAGCDHPVLELLTEAAESPAGAAGIVSTVGAQRMDARRLALPIGSLTLSTLSAADDPGRRRHLARAVVEGLAYAVRANLEQLDAASDAPHGSVHLAGGLSASALFGQILCDVLREPVRVAGEPETSALGAAICAGVAAGIHRDVLDGAAALARPVREHRPSADADAYAAAYAIWSAAEPARGAADDALVPSVLGNLQRPRSRESDSSAPGFRPRILVTADLDASGRAALEAIGDVDYQSFRERMRLLTGPDLVRALEGVHVFVAEVDVVDAASMASAADLRVIATCRGDAVNVDLDAATALGIPVLHTPGRNADAVADLTLAFLLMLARKLPESAEFLREPGGRPGDMGRMGRAFSKYRGRELWNKTVGLIGLGAVGRKVVERLRPFGARCLVHDPYLDDDRVRLAGAEPATLDEVLRVSDFVSLHAAVTDETRELIGARELALMRAGACLVNTARAALVDEAALSDALASGHLAGAALDVFSVEPPGSDDPLLAHPNVIATPHVGGNTEDVAAHQGHIVAGDLGRMAQNARPRHCLNESVLADFRWDAPRPPADERVIARLRAGPGPAVTDLQKTKPPRAAKVAAPKHAGADRPADAPAPGKEPMPTDQRDVRGGMEAILRSFVAGVAGDEALRAFSSGRDVTLHFTLSDLALAFHIGLCDGRVVAALGAPDESAEVELRMPADVLDGMFTGRVNAMQSAMNGELSFSGDTAKAMTLQHIQADLSRLYRDARETVGDPGDLTAIGAQHAATPASAPSGGDDLRLAICRTVDELYATQLITATGGNVSARIPGVDEAWITPSQLFKGDLSPEILVRIGFDGRAREAGARSPSSEALMHTAVFAARPDAQAVIHAHAPHATILANTGLPFLPISTEAAFFADLPRIPFIMPGTKDLADAVAAAMGEGWAVLLQNHGLLVAGRSLRRAADMVEIIERTSEVILGCYAVGKEPPVLPPETVKMLRGYGDLMA